MSKKVREIINCILFVAYPSWCLRRIGKIRFRFSDEDIREYNCTKLFPEFYQEQCKIYLDEYKENNESR